ncbi:hypothetical protein CPLU01_15517 [Colletotrichum plurivorum]|uniref:Uncharacterized protein n=1 Tax=Colletotrichum plurivorum TaxID=2175906 RepID=A0A8H6MV29_9PEZI|nr:hypothetical protein CPLU01_15517 [Colletotrichum plurivorum]
MNLACACAFRTITHTLGCDAKTHVCEIDIAAAGKMTHSGVPHHRVVPAANRYAPPGRVFTPQPEVSISPPGRLLGPLKPGHATAQATGPGFLRPTEANGRF